MQNGIIVYNSISNSIDKLNSRFCRGEFCVTPTGDIVACHRVTSGENFGLFNYGHIGEEISIDPLKKERIYNFFNKKYKQCNQCFAKWHCAGDCPAQRHLSSSCRCKFIKSLIKRLLEERLLV